MKILVVDDNIIILDAVQMLLTSRGYEVAVCSSADFVRNIIEAEHPDLLMLDMNMPSQDGCQLCRELREEGHRLPILFFSASDDASARAIGTGANGVIKKPFKAEQLIDFISVQLNHGSA